MSQDIGEQKNIIEQHPELAKEMRRTLREYVRKGRSTPGPAQQNNGDPIWDTVKWLEEEE